MLSQIQRRVTIDLLPPHQVGALILATIDQHGFITDRDDAKLTERAKATRSLDFKKLLELGLIERHGGGRSTYYQRAKT